MVTDSEDGSHWQFSNSGLGSCLFKLIYCSTAATYSSKIMARRTKRISEWQ